MKICFQLSVVCHNHILSYQIRSDDEFEVFFPQYSSAIQHHIDLLEFLRHGLERLLEHVSFGDVRHHKDDIGFAEFILELREFLCIFAYIQNSQILKWV